jgi:hypothetical protein
MGSGFDDWIYWHFFTITVSYYSPQLILTAEAPLHSAPPSTTLSTLLESHISTLFELSPSLESYLTTDGQSASLPWNKAPTWGLRPDFYYCQTVGGLLMWCAVSDERTGLSFTIAAGTRQHSHSRVRVPWDS